MTEFIDNEDYVYRRDSFDCRICDDLCPVILKYLSIYDKIRFECISKQFKNNVFKSHGLLFSKSDYYFMVKYQLVYFVGNNETYVPIFRLKAVQNILIKFKSINSIDIKTSFDEVIREPTNKILNLITKYCNNIKKIAFNFQLISKQTIESFGEKFGQSLQHIKFYGPENYYNKSSVIKLFPNLVTVENVMIDDIVSENDFKIMKNLKNIVIDSYSLEIDLFITFINNYCKQLKSFRITMKLFENEIGYKIMEKLSKLKCFQCLSIESDEFPFEFRYLSNLKQLKSLHLRCREIIGQKIIKSIDLKGCIQLTELILTQKCLSNEFFIDIDKHLPKLQNLKCYNSYQSVDKESLISLSKLNRLRKIYIDSIVINDEIVADIIPELIHNNKHIQCIKFRVFNEMTDKPLKGLIALAVKTPKILFSYSFGVKRALFYNLKFWKNKPNNLFLGFLEYIPDEGDYVRSVH